MLTRTFNSAVREAANRLGVKIVHQYTNKTTSGGRDRRVFIRTAPGGAKTLMRSLTQKYNKSVRSAINLRVSENGEFLSASCTLPK